MYLIRIGQTTVYTWHGSQRFNFDQTRRSIKAHFTYLRYERSGKSSDTKYIWDHNHSINNNYLKLVRAVGDLYAYESLEISKLNFINSDPIIFSIL